MNVNFRAEQRDRELEENERQKLSYHPSIIIRIALYCCALQIYSMLAVGLYFYKYKVWRLYLDLADFMVVIVGSSIFKFPCEMQLQAKESGHLCDYFATRTRTGMNVHATVPKSI